MEKFYELVIRHRKIIFAVFIGIAVICAMAQKFVSVNYDMNSYLPEALSYKEKLGEIDGVTDVTWLDDAVTAKIGKRRSGSQRTVSVCSDRKYRNQ